MISDEQRLEQKLEEEKTRSEKLARDNQVKDILVEQLKELECKVQRIMKYQKI